MSNGQGAAIRRAANDPQLRRLEAAFLTFSFAEHATWLTLVIYAYNRGGVSEASIVGFLHLIPAMIVAPFAAFAGDRFRPQRALSASYGLQALFFGTASVLVVADLPIAVYVATAIATCAMTVVRPVTGAVLPLVTHTPRDLVAANVVGNLVEQLGRCIGPLAAGLIIAASSEATVFAIVAVGLAGGAIGLIGLEVDRVEPAAIDASGVIEEIFGGFRAMRSEPVVRWLIAAASVGVFVVGALDIVAVTFATDVLDGERDAGFLQTAVGVGALLGAAIGTGLIGSARVMRYLILAGLMMATPFVVIGATTNRLAALAVFTVIGAGMSLTRFVATVGLQRLAPAKVLTRIFGVLEALTMICLALGAIAVAPIIAATSLGRATVILGVATAVVSAVCIVRLRKLGVGVAPPPQELFERVVGDPLFAALPVFTVERLVASLRPRDFERGAPVITEGEFGDEYFLIAAGEVTVSVDGAFIRRMGVGESFGEIALLHDVARTATVTASSDVSLFSIGRDEFLEAVTGHPRSYAEAHRVAERFLGSSPPQSS